MWPTHYQIKAHRRCVLRRLQSNFTQRQWLRYNQNWLSRVSVATLEWSDSGLGIRHL